MPPGLDDWEAWDPDEAARRLAGVGAPWWVVGGWALDLWHGRTTRDHEDLEIATTRASFDRFRRHLVGFRFFTAGGGEVAPLPENASPPEEHHQNWLFDPVAERWRLDLMLEPGDDETWICRRDPTIRMAQTEIVARSVSGIPYLRPEAVLLFKAKATRSKDEDDFTQALPSLDPRAKTWLREALERVHPDHAWIARLPDAEGV